MRILNVLMLVSALIGFCAPLAGGAPARALQREQSIAPSLAKIRSWVDRGPVFEAEQVRKMSVTLDKVDRYWVLGVGPSEEIQLVLLDFFGRCLRIEGQVAQWQPFRIRAEHPSDDKEQGLLRRVKAILVRRLPQSGRFLTLEVLMGRERGQSHPLERRVAACAVLKEDQTPQSTLGLLSCTRPTPPATSIPPELLAAAIRGIAGRDGQGVNLRLLDLLKKDTNGANSAWKQEIEAHFRSIEIPLTERRSIDALLLYVHAEIAAPDWRQASRAAKISRCLPDEAAFPVLIEALKLWIQRGNQPGAQVRRIQGEIVAELDHRSGRHLGIYAERWETLYESWQRGDIALNIADIGQEGRTIGGFFGLRPETDRVTFVLDHSHSMAESFGPKKGQNRLDEAVEQMGRLLGQLPANARFNVVTFADGARSWKSKLELADETSIQNARKWVLATLPRGGTDLREGVEEAMLIDKRGNVDLSDLETDTIIVLCDGQTSNGPTWVENFLRRANSDARVVFYAVQLGSGGDGTLEELCKLTGGEFLLVNG
ncbi:MAG: hypothetical protein ACI8X5_003283 [Planctomycetota bacterium]|jgi:hypothetical protein